MDEALASSGCSGMVRWDNRRVLRIFKETYGRTVFRGRGGRARWLKWKVNDWSRGK